MSDNSRLGGRRSWLPEVIVALGIGGLFAFVVGGALVLNMLKTLPSPATSVPMTPVPLGSAPVGAPHGKIAFFSGDPLIGGILVMEPDGSHLARLTSQAGYYYGLAWSPDGTRLAFGTPDTGADIFVLRTDGPPAPGKSNLINLTNSSQVGDNSPAWSPDGRRIVFVSDHGGVPRLYVVNADGTGLASVTTGPNAAQYPDWSPGPGGTAGDGTRIVFTSIVKGLEHLFLVAPDGTGLTALTSGSGSENTPRWSPDGTQIAYVSTASGGDQLCLIRPDGSGQRCLASGPYRVEDPRWSPDGTRIAFANTDIYVINVDGTGLIRLTTDPGQDNEPAWSPDGTQIVFVSARDGNSEIYVINVDGTGETRLTHNPGMDESPVWSR